MAVMSSLSCLTSIEGLGARHLHQLSIDRVSSGHASEKLWPRDIHECSNGPGMAGCVDNNPIKMDQLYQ